MSKRNKSISRAEADKKYGQGKNCEEVAFEGTQEEMAEAIRRAAAESGGTVEVQDDGSVVWTTPNGGTITSVLVTEEIEEQPS